MTDQYSNNFYNTSRIGLDLFLMDFNVSMAYSRV